MAAPAALAVVGGGAAPGGGGGGVGGGGGGGGVGGAADPAAAALALIQNMGDPYQDAVTQLEQERRDLKRRNQQVAKNLANERKRHKRLEEKARGLSDAALMRLIASRAAKAKAKAKGKAKAKAKG